MSNANIWESLRRSGWTDEVSGEGHAGLCAPGDTGPNRLVLSLRQAWFVQCWHEDTEDGYQPSLATLDAWVKTWAGRAAVRQFRKLQD